VYLVLKTFGLPEITVNSESVNSLIVGNYGKYDFGDWVNTTVNKDSKFTLVNQLIFDDPAKINAILFYVSKDENYKHSNSIGSLEIVFFKSDLLGIPNKLPFVNIGILKYTTGWNKIALSNIDELNNASGTLFYGIRWVYHPTEFHYTNVKKNKIYNFFGPKMGMTVNDKKIENSGRTYCYNSAYGWRKATLGYAMIALEILK
jgi:hypothetical protein